MDPSALSGIPLFADLDDDARAQIAGWMREVSIYTGEHLVKDGEWGYRFFVITDGTADVKVHGETVTTLGPGDFLGEIALSEAGRRSADVDAASHLTALTMMVWDFNTMLDTYPTVAEKINQAFEERRENS